jgi:hypothetical protein
LRELERRVPVAVLEAVSQLAHEGEVARAQLAFGLAFTRVAEGVEGRAAQAFEARQRREHRHQPAAELHLGRHVGTRLPARQQRRRQVEGQLVVAVELRRDLRAEGRVGMQARHFVLVLVSHHLEQVARHGLAQLPP